jgi:hypothetical protein
VRLQATSAAWWRPLCPLSRACWVAPVTSIGLSAEPRPDKQRTESATRLHTRGGLQRQNDSATGYLASDSSNSPSLLDIASCAKALAILA